MNTNNWFHTDGQQKYGPVTSLQLIKLIRTGRLTAQHLVPMDDSQVPGPCGKPLSAWRASSSKWQR